MQNFSDAIENTSVLSERVDWLTNKIAQLEIELAKLTHDGWMTLAEAAERLPNKSVSALRQRIKHPTKPMPEGKVWRQEAKGYEIQIHLANYRKYA